MLPLVLLLALAKTSISSRDASKICCPPESYTGLGNRTQSWDPSGVYCHPEHRGISARDLDGICPANIRPLMDKMRQFHAALTARALGTVTPALAEARASVARVFSKYKPTMHYVPGHIPSGVLVHWAPDDSAGIAASIPPFLPPSPMLKQLFSELNYQASIHAKKIYIIVSHQSFVRTCMFTGGGFWTDTWGLRKHFPFLTFIEEDKIPCDMEDDIVNWIFTSLYKDDPIMTRAHQRAETKLYLDQQLFLLQSGMESIAADNATAGMFFVADSIGARALSNSRISDNDFNLLDTCTDEIRAEEARLLGNDPSADYYFKNGKVELTRCNYPRFSPYRPEPPKIPERVSRQWARPMPNGRHR